VGVGGLVAPGGQHVAAVRALELPRIVPAELRQTHAGLAQLLGHAAVRAQVQQHVGGEEVAVVELLDQALRALAPLLVGEPGAAPLGGVLGLEDQHPRLSLGVQAVGG
jgi:hypothetical protein